MRLDIFSACKIFPILLLPFVFSSLKFPRRNFQLTMEALHVGVFIMGQKKREFETPLLLSEEKEP